MRMKNYCGAAFLIASASCVVRKYDYPFRNPDLPYFLTNDVDDLLSRLTPEEKVGSDDESVDLVIEIVGEFSCGLWNGG